ncbi:DNA polymerase III subunit gamma/tau [Streptococcus halichoeri]|uniref:DNA polymerase III subunit gamma/tau n=1 Tax=Streptococcus halichoeri TaxID=254785 RepID=UPI001C8DD90F|nr:DNA polymerase III subunit gamma/tau [Streptococcus halichoeri]
MYQALYRKYRSQTFEEMVGQSLISQTLRQTVESGKISHAYLFSGPRGTGKTSAAKIFAKAMNCPNQVNGEPCNRCAICKEITNGSLEDVIEIDAASNNGVDEIREIRDKSTYAPSQAEYKVYIIDEVHMLSTGAFNALLKTLEEPTAHVVFILATTELHKIPATILSRVQRFEFKAIKQADIVHHLTHILDQEGISYENKALELIARRAEGGMRDALSILDQVLSLSSDHTVTLTIAEEMTGTISRQALDNYVLHVSQTKTQAALADLATIFDSGKSMSRFATDLLIYLRDLLMVKAGAESFQFSSTFESNQQLTNESLFQMIDLVTKHLPAIKKGTHPRIYAEMMTIELAQSQESVAQPIIPENLQGVIDDLKHEVSELKKQLSQSAQSGRQTAGAGVSALQKRGQQQSYKVDRTKILTIMEETVRDSEQSRGYLEALKEAWNEILDSIGPQDRALLLGSEPVLANSENAILAFDAAFNAEQAMLRTDLNDMFGNIMSQAAGFSPNILAVPRADFNRLRSEFANHFKGKQKQAPEVAPAAEIPVEFDFLSERMTTIED